MLNIFCIRPRGFNIGNEVIHQGTLALVRRAFGSQVNVISLPATSRYESHAKAGLTARTIHEINQYGHGVIVGGGNLFENGELEMDLAALGALDVPLMLFSLGAGRIYNRRRRLTLRTDAMPPDRIRTICDRADVTLVRDDRTADYLRSLGCDDVVAAGCPSLLLADHLRTAVDAVGQPDDAAPQVLFSIRTPELMNIPLPDQARVRGDILAIMELLRQRGFDDVKLLCHDHRDLPFAASFGDVEYLYTDDVLTYLDWLRSCRLQIGYRLHATLPCMVMGTPSISISYDERAISLLETAGLGLWDVNMIETPDVADRVADRLSRIDELDRLRRDAFVQWRQLETRMNDGFDRFARAVLEAKQGQTDHDETARKLSAPITRRSARAVRDAVAAVREHVR